MKKTIVLSVILAFCLSGICLAEFFKIKPFTTGVTYNIAREKSSNQPLWASEIKWVDSNIANDPFVNLEEKGSGIYGKDRKFKKWESSSYYRRGGLSIIPDHSKLVYKDQNDAIMQTIETTYDFKTRIAIVKVDGNEKQFELSEDLIDRQLLGTALAEYPFEEKRDFIFPMMTNEPRVYMMTVKYAGEESLLIGKQMVACYKLQMVPDLGSLNIFGSFVPKTFFWYSKAEPHLFMRYEGLESGLGTPYIVIERLELNQ
jgi:hypothetical protein